MPRTQKPRWGAGWGGFYNFKYLSDEDFQELAIVLGVDRINNEIRSNIQKIVRDYASEKHFFEDHARLAQVRAALKKVRDKPEAFYKKLDELDSRASWEITTRIETSEIIPTAADTKSAAEQALQDLRMDRGGRPKNKAVLRALITELQSIFKELTGQCATITWHDYREAYEGFFYDFVSKFSEIINPEETWSNLSLGQQIKAALKSSKRP